MVRNAIQAWRSRRRSVDAAEDATTNPGNAGKRGELLGAFRKRYNFNLEVELQPSDSALKLLTKLHPRRSGDFVSLEKVTNFLDARDLRAENESGAKIGKEITLMAGGGRRAKAIRL